MADIKEKDQGKFTAEALVGLPVAKRRKLEDITDTTSDDQVTELCDPTIKAQPSKARGDSVEFRVVNNDAKPESTIVLSNLKCVYQQQLPNMPKWYIARLVYDRSHISIAMVRHSLEVVGGITYRPFKKRRFAEIVFCAVNSNYQVKGHGSHLMSRLKDYVKASSSIMHFLTCADNCAIGYFKKQGFTKEITLDKKMWMGYIKDYDGAALMQCSMLPRIRYAEAGRMLRLQKECVQAKIRAHSRSYVVHSPPMEWKNGVRELNPLDIPAIRDSGWSPSMDTLARESRHGPNYKQLLYLLNKMMHHKAAWPFRDPVNGDEVTGYYDVITKPMDLSTMETRLEADQYITPAEFVSDAKLMFDNCRKFNNKNTSYARSANTLEKFMWRQIKAAPEWVHLQLETVVPGHSQDDAGHQGS